MPQLVLPYPDFVAGTKILSSQVDANNSAITTWANGNIDDINIKAAAGIVRSKLAATEPATVAHSARGTATSTGNFDSFDVELLTSVWDGTAAQTRKMGLRTKVTSLTAYKLALLDNAGTEVASVDQTGTFAGANLLLGGGSQLQRLTVTEGNVHIGRTGGASLTLADHLNTAAIVGIPEAGVGTHLAFNTGGVEKARLTSAGNFGVGTTNPTAKLEVNGTIKAGDMTTGNLTAPALIVSGLTGATAASRYVGATTSGAPASGTFAVGDYVIDQGGIVWVCTTAGSPGVWRAQLATPSESVQGDILIRDASSWTRLPPGTSGQVLKTQGSAANPIWGDAATGSMTKIAETILAADAASISFSSIPGTYRHLRLKLLARSTNAVLNTILWIRLNGDSAANYWAQHISSTSTNLSASNEAGVGGWSFNVPGANAPASVAAGIDLLILDYARTQWEKTGISHSMLRDTSTSSNVRTSARWWAQTAAVTSLQIVPDTGNLALGTIATLYGVS